MDARTAVTLAELAKRGGEEVGLSRWFSVDQARIDAFADATDDHQFIHLDAGRAAAETPFGGTVAHGFLTLSLLSAMSYDALPPIAGQRHGVNYGFERLRFVTPVRSGSKLRGRFKLVGAQERRPGEWMLRHAATVEIESLDRPALVADWITLVVLDT